jgi:glutathione S-transferase
MSLPVIFADIGQFVPQSFIDDRTKMMPGRDFNDVPKQAPHAREQLRALIATLDVQLADGRPWLLGADFSLADAACWHPLWFCRVSPGASAIVAQFAAVQRWMERIDALGVGERSNTTPAEALAVAKAATPAAGGGVAPNEPNGLGAGAQVSVTPDDYGFDPVAGELVTANVHEVAVRRHDPAVGDVVVHFPRIGFRVATA